MGGAFIRGAPLIGILRYGMNLILKENHGDNKFGIIRLFVHLSTN